MKQLRLGILTGSARKESFSQKTANTIADSMARDFDITFIKIDDLPMFNQDYDDDGTTPAEWLRFRTEIREMDAFLFVTPEYNRSYPALIKNALDIASRPPGQNLWSDKPAALVTISPGSIGGFGASQHLRQVCGFLNLHVMSQPEAYLGNITDALDQDGNISAERTLSFLKRIAGAFTDWIHLFTK